ncbi:hypothetical protein FRACA_590019 [Frankia canadensis]|uniref:Uncharacterized protein n=1 Tax=Frankia canadensis TaxID=1836972 RepID=A0A2I2KZB2_9ACTN|nr:hypothetical protein [Frankia canadensis]SNQ50997.1 hypothetical protein FRACA_590019 [Frankia canadensis]SOU58287.1 hypothetical protein FRACA_590019 [Frankia canadensis]
MPFDNMYPQDRPEAAVRRAEASSQDDQIRLSSDVATECLTSDGDDLPPSKEMILERLTAADPAVASLLAMHPYREAILDRTAAALEASLAEAREAQADPPPVGDLAEVYSRIPPSRLTETLLTELVEDHDSWISNLRHTPELFRGSRGSAIFSSTAGT